MVVSGAPGTARSLRCCDRILLTVSATAGDRR